MERTLENQMEARVIEFFSFKYFQHPSTLNPVQSQRKEDEEFGILKGLKRARCLPLKLPHVYSV